MGMVGSAIRALDNPVGMINTVKKLAPRYLIYGCDRKTFQSFGMALSSALEHVIGPEKVRFVNRLAIVF